MPEVRTIDISKIDRTIEIETDRVRLYYSASIHCEKKHYDEYRNFSNYCLGHTDTIYTYSIPDNPSGLALPNLEWNEILVLDGTNIGRVYTLTYVKNSTVYEPRRDYFGKILQEKADEEYTIGPDFLFHEGYFPQNNKVDFDDNTFGAIADAATKLFYRPAKPTLTLAEVAQLQKKQLKQKQQYKKIFGQPMTLNETKAEIENIPKVDNFKKIEENEAHEQKRLLSDELTGRGKEPRELVKKLFCPNPAANIEKLFSKPKSGFIITYKEILERQKKQKDLEAKSEEE